MFIDSSVVVEILIDGDRANELLGRMAESRSICTGPTVIYESATVLATRLGRQPEETKLLYSASSNASRFLSCQHPTKSRLPP